MSDLILTRLSAVRSKHTLVAVATGAAMCVALVLVWTIMEMWLDWRVADGLARWARALSLLLELAALGAIIFTRIFRPITRAPDDEEVALMIERRYPNFKTRLISAVQFTNPAGAVAGSPSLIKATVRQAEKLADETPVTEVVATRDLNRSLATAAVVCIVAIFLFLFTQPTSGLLLQRAFLSNVKLPTKTHIESVSGDLRVALGDSLKITATVSGYHPPAGTIEITYASGRYQELPIEKDPNTPDTYAITLDSVLENFAYTIRVYDGHSDPSTVTALERPEIANIEILQVYPAYTGMGTVPRQTGDLTLLAGSKLKIKVTCTKPLRVAPLAPGKANYVLRVIDEKIGHSDTIPLMRSRQNLKIATADGPDGNGMPLPPGLDYLSVHLIDTDDLESKDAAVYPVALIPDRAPTVRITEPERKEELVTAQAKLEIGYLAEDDILLGKVNLKYKVGDGSGATESTPETIALPLPPNTRTQKATYLWDISKIPVPPGKPTLEGSVIEYWLEVEDTNNLSGPGKGASEHYAARVVTRAEKQAEMAQRSGEAIIDIKNGSDNQDNLAQKVGTEINQTPRAPKKP